MRKILLVISLLYVLIWVQVLANNTSAPGDIKPNVYKLAKEAFTNAQNDHLNFKSSLLTIVDFSLPSTKKRLWVIDTKTNRILLSALVAHGKGSGLNYAKHFSNDPHSRESCLGLFITGAVYYGHDGKSLHLNGLEHGFNDNASRRGIVIHGAPYVSKQFAHTNHRLGRSWGCFAVSEHTIKRIIPLIKNHTLLFAYYPSENWLNHSQFLK